MGTVDLRESCAFRPDVHMGTVDLRESCAFRRTVPSGRAEEGSFWRKSSIFASVLTYLKTGTLC